jgi:hypothetical protein
MDKINSDLTIEKPGIFSNQSHTLGYFEKYRDQNTGEFVEKFYRFRNDNLTFISTASLSGIAVLGYFLYFLFS